MTARTTTLSRLVIHHEMFLAGRMASFAIRGDLDSAARVREALQAVADYRSKVAHTEHNGSRWN